MNPRRFNRIMSAQLDGLRRENLIDVSLHAELAERYRYEGWNWLSLGRWLLLFGAVSTAAGLYFVGIELFEFTLRKAAVLLGVAIAAAFYGAHALGRRGLTWSQRSLELFAGLLLIALTFTLGMIYSSGSGNWPALLLIDLVVLLALAYARNNVLLLVLSAIVFFTWFGGVTGYLSGWGAYWFGMNYPLRFFFAGSVIAGIGLLHRYVESGFLASYRGFFKVWLSSGVFFTEMALWLMSLFGNFGSMNGQHSAAAGELWFFNLLWAGCSALLLYAGGRYGLRMLRGYGVTFLIIQAYTLFFWHVAEHLGGVLSTFVAAGVTLALVVHFEKQRRSAQ